MAGGGQADFAGNPGELLQASPSIVLADPAGGPQEEHGRVLSVAPLMGATASIDAGHARWLHVKVRPPARGLLKAARVSAFADYAACVDEKLDFSGGKSRLRAVPPLWQ